MARRAAITLLLPKDADLSGRCVICGYRHTDNDCWPTCAGCGLPMDQVVAGMDAGCPVCTRFCEVGLEEA